MTTFEVPTLTTARLRLRAFRANDLDAYASMQANPEVTRYLGGRTLTPLEAWRIMALHLGQWALRGYGMWACEKLDGGAFVGYVGVFQPFDWPEPEIAYSLDRPFWGQGFATEGASATRDWLFSHFPLQRVVFSPTITHRNASRNDSVPFTSAHLNCAVLLMSIGCTTGESLLTQSERPPRRASDAATGTGPKAK